MDINAKRRDQAAVLIENLKIIGAPPGDVARLEERLRWLAGGRRSRVGLGNTTTGSGWQDLLTDLTRTWATVEQQKNLSDSERRAMEMQLKQLQEQNAIVEKQIQLTLAQRGTIAAEAVRDSFIDKPWALPALIGLGGALLFLMMGRRK